MYKYSKVLIQWELLGRYRGHTRHIVQIMFGTDPDAGTPLLFSLGKDMKLNEYDLEASSGASGTGLVLRGRTSVEQRCLPTAMAWYSPSSAQETFLLTANKQHKQRLVNLSTKMCRKVVVVLYCIVLYCTVLYCIVLYCTVLH